MRKIGKCGCEECFGKIVNSGKIKFDKEVEGEYDVANKCLSGFNFICILN